MAFVIEYHTTEQIGTDERNVAIFETLKAARVAAEEISRETGVIVEVRELEDDK